MATSGDMTTFSGEDFRHTCGLCMEPYRGRQPKILPCFHTFCLPCLTTLAASATAATVTTSESTDNTEKETNAEGTAGDCDNQRSEEPDAQSGRVGEVCGKVAFLCPTCRAPVTVPEGGVASLQTNFYLDFEEAYPTSAPLPCDMCEEGSQPQDATHVCDTCEENMCRACRRFHDKFTDKGSHRVRPLGLQDQIIPSTEPTMKTNCHVHPDQPVCVRCQKCDVSICLICKLTSHESHATQDLQAAVRQAREELPGLLLTAKQQMQVIEASLDRLDRDERELTRQEQEMTQEVSARYNALITKATRARDEFQEALRTKKREAQTGICEEKAAADNTLKTLSAHVKRATLLPTQDAGVVMVKNELQAALLSDDALDKHNQRASRENHLAFFPCDVDTSAVDTDVMGVYMGQLRDDDPNTYKTTAPVFSLKEFANKVSSLDADINSRIAALTSDMAAAKTAIQKAAKAVAFFASLESERSVTYGYETLKFENIRLNEGDGYSSYTGLFTAPVQGYYLILLTLRKDTEQFDGGIKVCRGTISDVYRTDTGSCHVILKLDVGTTVMARAGSGKYAPKASTFCGALLRECQ